MIKISATDEIRHEHHPILFPSTSHECYSIWMPETPKGYGAQEFSKSST